jgi:dihydrofolate reductase
VESSHLIEGDVPEAVAELKQQPGQDLIIYGCHDLMHILLEHDLIDEYRLWVYPVVLGKGGAFSMTAWSEWPSISSTPP